MTIYPVPMKTCSKCHCEKASEEFHDQKEHTDNKTSWCKSCARKRYVEWSKRPENKERRKAYNKEYHKGGYYHVLRTYGIQREQWDLMNIEANGCCAVCHLKKKLCVDHDHKTGANRGLLCNDCNLLLGRASDSKKTITRSH